MARRVRGPLILKGIYAIPGMPPVTGRLASHYEHLLPSRFNKFQVEDEELVRITDHKTLEYRQHYLRYEAESLFWNLLYWCMTAQPTKQVEVDSQVAAQGFSVVLPWIDWGVLISKHDMRHDNFISYAILKTALFHPAYAPLHSLLDQMREYLRCDLDEATNPIRKEPEYLHEVFQRSIINFLDLHHDDPVVTLQRSDTLRKTDQPNMMGSSSTSKTRTSNSGGEKRKAEDDKGVQYGTEFAFALLPVSYPIFNIKSALIFAFQ